MRLSPSLIPPKHLLNRAHLRLQRHQGRREHRSLVRGVREGLGYFVGVAQGGGGAVVGEDFLEVGYFAFCESSEKVYQNR